MDIFSIKRGDTSPAVRYALLPATIDLAGANVQFQMRSRFGVTIVDLPAVIITDLPPVVQYNWQAIDTATAGQFEAEFRVTYADGAIETFPNTEFIQIRIAEDVR